MAQEDIRKGPWTEAEDDQLVFYVKLFGDRRWDFIAKVSGLKVVGDNQTRYDYFGMHYIAMDLCFKFLYLGSIILGLKRTGKSCRLRWVNYLRPGLRRGKMTPHEEQLVLKLHAKWGNKWSRIARKIPGRTDNEIKNYWRTHMRKKAQEMKRGSFPPSGPYFSSTSSPSSSITGITMVDSDIMSFYDIGSMINSSSLFSNTSGSSFDTNETKYYDMGGLEMLIPKRNNNSEGKMDKITSMDDIWKDIELPESETLHNLSSEIMISPIWNYYPDSSWVTEEEIKMGEIVSPPVTDQIFTCYSLEANQLAG